MTFASRDRLAGGVVALLGLGTAYAAWGYQVGTPQRMGPGFFPFALGCVLAGLGVLLAVAPGAPGGGPAVAFRPEWKGWLCIAGGVLAFIMLGAYFGLVPATFGCVLVAALGDRTATWRQSVLFAAGVTVFGALLFSYLLKVPLPLFAWPLA